MVSKLHLLVLGLYLRLGVSVSAAADADVDVSTVVQDQTGPPVLPEAITSAPANAGATFDNGNNLLQIPIECRKYLAGGGGPSEMSAQMGPGSFIPTVSFNPDDVGFYLYYDKNNPDAADQLYYNDAATIRSAHFVPGAPVTFVVHGFLSSYNDTDSMVPFVKNAYLQANFPNVIAVDWGKLAKADSLVAAVMYPIVLQNVPTVGKRLCDMIRFLINYGVMRGPQDVHIVGHSLGAHVSGLAGACIRDEAKENGGSLIGRISGLDPAGPGYKILHADERLDATDATFVDAIHTSENMLGTWGNDRIGTVDFYANGGNGLDQPQCEKDSNLIQSMITTLSGICAHSRPWQYFARSILRAQPELVGCRCADSLIQYAIPIPCLSPAGSCEAPILYGEYMPLTVEGKFYINVPENLSGLT